MKSFDCFALDTANQCLWCNGVQIALAPKPFAVLRFLVDNPGRLITHDELLDALWPETYVQPQVLRTYMLELRKVLGDDPGQPRFIQTLPKRGYCFVAPVAERSAMDRGRPSPASAKDVKAAEIVGRANELVRLHAQFEIAQSGKRQVVFVCGEAGIGKTALVDAFCRQLDSAQAATLAHGQCVQGICGNEEFYPVIEALGQLCASPQREAACRILSRIAPAWLAHGREPEVAAASPAPPNSRQRLVGDLCAALEELAAEQPLLLVFEDLHWADDSTLNLISALARRHAPARLMVLATLRSRKSSAAHPLKELKQDLLMRRLCAEIVLAPLPKSAVTQLLSRELGQPDLPPELAAFVYRRSEGNPLFVIAVLEHLIAQHILVRKDAAPLAAWQQAAPLAQFPELDDSVPDQLAQMIELEIERLSPEQQHMLEAGSLMHVAFPAWAVAAALELDAADTEEACDELARKLYFVERAGQDELPGGACSAFYVFAHGLYREVLYRRQPATRRAKRHIRIAQQLGQLFAGREASVAREIAMHYEAAGQPQRGKFRAS
ncbi:MAG: AAA family ATPase [Terracidiphilus sp.]|nr:AAA family ATPase [Terracidiphilus sp.]